ncbi:Pentatricopeptide repeat-containing protein, chloroplastic [Glycine soja]|nr:Pentatricopeptide repeat-containing protein, chloroplastic [Glycine soja]
MMAMTCESSIVSPLFLSRICQAKTDPTRAFLLENKFSTITVTASPRKGKKTTGKKEHHLWKSRDSAQSGQKALALVRTVYKLPNEKEAVYGALDKWTAWETEFPVAKWMISKGQGAMMGTYDTLLLAFDMDKRDHHNMLDKIIEVFADMEELRVKPDEDTVRRVARAFRELGEEEKWKLVIKRYGLKWKYIHFNGERVS